MPHDIEVRGGQVPPGCPDERLAHSHLPAQIVPAFLQRCDDLGRPPCGRVLAPEFLKRLEVPSEFPPDVAGGDSDGGVDEVAALPGTP
ncbi:hypothetical protein [Streptomyces sp. NPDC050759]|uniref:hypothetical protein n=1 Tax=Streptomyces sp. NPDC050759 TaxID=3365635 RepID=UPI0037A683E3